MASQEQRNGLGGDLLLSDELREQLGLSPRESLRVLNPGGRLLLLQRDGAGDTPSTPIPWDRDLVLTCDVRAFPLADVLSMIHGAAKSGFLSFNDGDCEKSVYLSQGEVVFGASNQKVDRLGECLLRAGVISLEQLSDAEVRVTAQLRFGKVLVERGVLTPRQLWDGVKHQVEEIVRSLFAYTRGVVHFWEGEVEPDNVVRLSLPTRRLIAEGLRRRDELLKFLAVLEDSRVRLRAEEGHGRELAGNERILFDALASEEGFPGLCRRAGLDPLSAARTVQLLQMVGAIRVVRDDEVSEFMDGPDPRTQEQDSVRECVRNHARLLVELAAPLIALDGGAAVGKRLSGVVEETAGRFPELLSGLLLSDGGLIDPDALAERALRLTGDRERTVRQALGELVSYLEFELKNHPRIEEPENFLEAVEGLRASIGI